MSDILFNLRDFIEVRCHLTTSASGTGVSACALSGEQASRQDNEALTYMISNLALLLHLVQRQLSRYF
jgi:hypothetical protein